MVVSAYYETFPLHPQPESLESLTSYIRRLAEVNQIRFLSELVITCFPDQTISMVSNLRDYPLMSMKHLQTAAACSEASLLATTFYHIGNKFGYTRFPDLLPAFLSKRLARCLRYCPHCLTELRYYQLIWRFSKLLGCPRHACYLLHSCAHCGQALRLMGPPLKIGICSYCLSDLKSAKSNLLTEVELFNASKVAQGLEFLLSPQTGEAVRNLDVGSLL